MIPEGSKKGWDASLLRSLQDRKSGVHDPSVALRLPTAIIRNRFAVRTKLQLGRKNALVNGVAVENA
jgi:hypothetical protein